MAENLVEKPKIVNKRLNQHLAKLYSCGWLPGIIIFICLIRVRVNDCILYVSSGVVIVSSAYTAILQTDLFVILFVSYKINLPN